MQMEDDSLWESFPQALETLEGVGRYINAFQAPLQDLNNLNSNQVHALRACSVLAIPPPMERMPPSGGFPKDLLELNLSGWATLIQDMVAGLQAVPPNLVLDVGLPAMILLQLLEATTGVGICHFCCHPSPWCKCMGAYQQAPTETWRQVVEQIPGYGVAASSGGVTTPSTTTAEMPGYVMPPLGLTLPDFSNWSLPPPEIPPSRGLLVASQGLPGIGRSDMIWNAVGRHARVQLVVGLWAPGQWALALPMSVPSAPQVAPPLHQPHLSKAATLYQQAVQPLGKSTGRVVTVESPSDRAAPVAGQTTQDHRRQQTRGRGDRGRLASLPGGAQGATSNVPSTTTSEATLPQQGGRAKASRLDPALLVAKFCSGGWKKDLEHVLKVYYKHNIQASYREAEWVRVRDRFFEHFLPHKEEALAIKERSPLDFMPLIEEQFWRAMGLCLQ